MFIGQQERAKALGTFSSKTERNKYKQMSSLFFPKQSPKSGDWLFSHQQKHQTFSDYRLPYYNPVTPQRKTIYLQQFGQFDKHFMQQLCCFCECFYQNLTVKCLQPIDFEKNLPNITIRQEPILQFQKQNGVVVHRDQYYGKQYLAQDILAFMEKRVPKDAYCVMGITLKDIYSGKNWNYVYGWAYYVARVGIFSFLRWDQEFAAGKTDEINWKAILYPSIRTMVHEIGHMFGVTHCVYYRCLMNGFNCIQQNYKNPLQFCPICYRKMMKNMGFNEKERYKRLLKYCKQLQMKQFQGDIVLFEKLETLSDNKIILENKF